MLSKPCKLCSLVLFATCIIVHIIFKYYFYSKSDKSYALSEIMTGDSSSTTTVIAVYFQFIRSKYDTEAYNAWLSNFLMSVEAPLVIFTDNHTKDLIVQKRYRRPTNIIIYENVWKLMQELEETRNKSYIENYRTKQHGMSFVIVNDASTLGSCVFDK
jgi:hypothetical protein